jgi:aspartyl aminopeptidase
MFSDYDEYMQTIRSSVLISCDNAHAIHPNYPSKHDANHMPYINKGAVIKVNANQRYASSSKTIARFKNVADSIGESYQEFVTRSDMGCGSTIGPITASKIGIDTLDVGVPTWAMHSIREICGSDDAHSLYKILVHY